MLFYQCIKSHKITLKTFKDILRTSLLLQKLWRVGLMALSDSVSVYIGPSPREGKKEDRNERREKKMSKQTPPAPTAIEVGPCPTFIQISRTPRHGSLPSTIALLDYPCKKCELLVIELRFMHLVLSLTDFYQCNKFHLIPFHTFRAAKILVIGLRFLHSVILPMTLYQCIKFH